MSQTTAPAIPLNAKEMPSAAIWTDLERVILSEVSQTGKETYWYDFPYTWNLKRNDTNELTK